MTTLKPGGDLPEHLGHVFAEVTLWSSFAGKKQQWRSGMMALDAKNPKDDEGQKRIAASLAQKLYRELIRRPMAGIRRAII